MARTLLTDKELHELQPHLSVWTINQLRRRGQIPTVQFPGIRRFFFDKEAIELWLDNLKRQGMQPETQGLRKAK